MYEIAEAIAPTWERRRADIEEVATPVREWMLRELRPRDGDTVLELAAGVGDTGFEAAAIVGDSGRLITTDFSPAMLDAARRRGAELGLGERRLPGHRRRADRARRRFGRPRALPVRLHAHGRPRGRVRRDPPRAAPGRPAGARGVGRPRSATPSSRSSRISLVERGHIPPPEPPPAPGPFSMASAERIERAAARRRLRRGAHRGGAGAVRRCRTSDEYLGLIADTAGPIALALRGLPDAERAASRRTSRIAAGASPSATATRSRE